MSGIRLFSTTAGTVAGGIRLFSTAAGLLRVGLEAAQPRACELECLGWERLEFAQLWAARVRIVLVLPTISGISCGETPALRATVAAPRERLPAYMRSALMAARIAVPRGIRRFTATAAVTRGIRDSAQAHASLKCALGWHGSVGGVPGTQARMAVAAHPTGRVMVM